LEAVEQKVALVVLLLVMATMPYMVVLVAVVVMEPVLAATLPLVQDAEAVLYLLLVVVEVAVPTDLLLLHSGAHTVGHGEVIQRV